MSAAVALLVLFYDWNDFATLLRRIVFVGEVGVVWFLAMNVRALVDAIREARAERKDTK